MKSIIRSRLATAVVAAALAGAAAASPGDGFGAGMHEITPQMQERMQSRLQARLDKMADRLQIKASQQEAWQAYVKAHKEQFDPAALKALPQEADAATIARHRADRAALMAQRLAAIADATAKLQSALTPEQAKTLADILRHPMGEGRRGGWGGRGEHGPRGPMGGGMR
jgi:hypothetical protein